MTNDSSSKFTCVRPPRDEHVGVVGTRLTWNY
jgi:hypothetical protein